MKDPAAKARRQEMERRMLPFFVEFVKFSAIFAVIVATAMFMLRVTVAAQ